MNIWTTTRFLTYLVAFAASGLALFGYAAFDGTIVDVNPILGLDLPPVNIAEIAGFIASGLAMVAVALGWGQK